VRIKRNSIQRIAASFATFLMISTIFVGIVHAIFEYVDVLPPVTSQPLVIDTNFYNDSSLGYDYQSSTPMRKIYFDEDLDNKDVAYSIVGKSDRLNLKDPSITIDSNKTQPSNLGKISSRCNLKSSPSSKNLIKYDGDNFDISYEATLNGIKETIIIKSPLYNITDDLLIKSSIELPKGFKGKMNKPIKNRNFVFDKITFEKNGDNIFSLPQPILWDTPELFQSSEGKFFQESSRSVFNLSHRLRSYENNFVHEVLIPNEILRSSNLKYPLFIDPSITTFGGFTEYQGYDNGTIKITNGLGEETWVSSPGKLIQGDI
jgi:hypothetical protein